MDAAKAGDIVAVIGLRSARTGDTVGAPGSKLLLESIEAYQPVISLAIEPRNADEGKALDEALDLVGAEPLEAENSCDPDYILNGVELWYDDLDLVPDNYGEESEDE